MRDRVVLTTKFTNSVDPGDPNAGGNGRKHMIRAVEASLRRLRTDYIDLFLLHTWDRDHPGRGGHAHLRRPRQGRQDPLRRACPTCPAWYAARAQTYAEAHALAPMVSLQLPYSLVERTIEAEHVAMGQTLGLGITAWSPLGGGFLTGKYRHADQGLTGDGRLSGDGAPGLSWSDREWQASDGTRERRRRAGRDDGPGRDQLGRHPARGRLGDHRGEQRGRSSTPTWPHSTSSCRPSCAPSSTRPGRAARGVYRMFTPEYQSWLVSPGVKVGDKPAGYAPAVRNWTP